MAHWHDRMTVNDGCGFNLHLGKIFNYFISSFLTCTFPQTRRNYSADRRERSVLTLSSFNLFIYTEYSVKLYVYILYKNSMSLILITKNLPFRWDPGSGNEDRIEQNISLILQNNLRELRSYSNVSMPIMA